MSVNLRYRFNEMVRRMCSVVNRSVWIGLASVLVGSCLVGGLTAVSLIYWYPGCFAGMLDIWSVLSKVLLGEVLLSTLFVVVLRGRGKSAWHLRLDLGVIGVLRVLAVAYGASVLYQARPMLVVFAVDQFEVLAAYEFDGSLGEVTAKAGVTPGMLGGPVYVALRVPEDLKQREQMLMFELAGGRAAGQTRYYAPYTHSSVVARARSLADVADKRDKAAVDAEGRELAASMHVRIDDVKWVPTKTRFGFSYGLVLAGVPGVLAIAPMSAATDTP